MMSFKTVHISLFYAICLGILVSANIRVPCVTPYKEEGICIDVNECSTLADYMKDSLQSAVIDEYIKQSKCHAPRAKTPHICCPINNIQQETDFRIGENKVEGESTLLPVIPNCGELFQDRIIPGLRADLYDYPWLALLKYESDNKTEFKCGGILINDRYVLTAAHCASNTLVAVRLGEHDLKQGMDCDNAMGHIECNDPPQDIAIEEVISHEEGDVDLALVRLKKKYTPSEFVHPICLPIKKNKPRQNITNLQLTISGWNQTLSNIRLHNNIVALDNTECRQKLKINLDSRRMCAQRKNKVDFCASDSGGPLIFNDNSYWMVYGVYSFGLNECSWPTVYTRVIDYVDWIVKTVKP